MDCARVSCSERKAADANGGDVPIMNTQLYPWLADLDSIEAKEAIREARRRYETQGVVTFPDFVCESTRQQIVASLPHDKAFTTDDAHTAYLREEPDPTLHPVYNHRMATKVASLAYDELPVDGVLAQLYPALLPLVSRIVNQKLHLSEDPLGCCSINVFRPGYHHSFHFDESDFSTTLMLQPAARGGLFQYTDPLRTSKDDLVVEKVAATIQAYEQGCWKTPLPPPPLHTLDFPAGTLSLFRGSTMLHRVTQVEESTTRLVAVLTYSKQPHFCNSAAVQKLFWGRSKQPGG